MGEVLANDNAANKVTGRTLSNAIRALSMDGVERANSGHPGMPMGMADVATVLFTRFLKFDACAPDWPDRDRFVLSAGHGSMLLYSLLYLTGYPGMDVEDLKAFRQLGSKTAGHPEYGHAAGIETTTGPLGQGLGNAVGMALSERLLNARLGDGVVDHYTYAIAGDGCLMEGISHEAISLAGHLKLNKLIVLWDDNGISIDGAVDLSCSDDQLKRFEGSGWDTARADAHDAEAVAAAIEAARQSDKPSLIACKSIIGFGAPSKQGTSATHGAPLGDEEIAATREELGWPHAPFEIPDDILETWRAAGARGASAREAWEARAQAALGAKGIARLGDPVDAEAAQAIKAGVAELKSEFTSQKPKLATRVSSQQVLEKLVPVVPGIIGGSADLTGSNGTLTSHQHDVTPGDYGGSSNSAAIGQIKGSSNSAAIGQIKSSYLRYGIREHGMAAAMNGMALHGGLVPYGATFLVFTDYCRPSIRLSALMGIRVIYVMTHDSIGLGEDGPTHQPVEHLASLRAIPNLNVLRPADATECAECWEIALTSQGTPSILALTRQGLPALRIEDTKDNLCARGAYVLRQAQGKRDVTLLATGSEVGIAVNAAETLQGEGVSAAVVSMPCWELFEAQDAAYRAEVLGQAPRIGIEAAMRFGWDKWLGEDGGFIGMDGFGASAPIDRLYEKFGITAEAVASAAKALGERKGS